MHIKLMLFKVWSFLAKFTYFLIDFVLQHFVEIGFTLHLCLQMNDFDKLCPCDHVGNKYRLEYVGCPPRPWRHPLNSIHSRVTSGNGDIMFSLFTFFRYHPFSPFLAVICLWLQQFTYLFLFFSLNYFSSTEISGKLLLWKII